MEANITAISRTYSTEGMESQTWSSGGGLAVLCKASKPPAQSFRQTKIRTPNFLGPGLPVNALGGLEWLGGPALQRQRWEMSH